MFKPEFWQSHDEYRTIVITFGRRLSRNNPKYSFGLYHTECQKELFVSRKEQFREAEVELYGKKESIRYYCADLL